MAKKGGKTKRLMAWCWYCGREFEDEKVLILHQKAKHFKCLCCSRRLNSASGLVVHMAQIHKETIDTVPNSVLGHDTPEIEIFGMQGVPPEDLQRHYDGLPIVPYKKSLLGDTGLVSLLAAHKAALSGNPLPMSAHIHLKQVQVIEGIGPSQAIPHLQRSADQSVSDSMPPPPPPQYMMPPVYPHHMQMMSPPIAVMPPTPSMPIVSPISPQHITTPSFQALQEASQRPDLPVVPITPSFTPLKINSSFDPKTGKRQPTSFVMIADPDISPVQTISQAPFTNKTV